MTTTGLYVLAIIGLVTIIAFVLGHAAGREAARVERLVRQPMPPRSSIRVIPPRTEL